MSLDSEELIRKLDEKATFYMGDNYILLSNDFKQKLWRVISESIIEHIQQYAEVTVIVTGNDLGSTLDVIPSSTEQDPVTTFSERIIDRGDPLFPPTPEDASGLIPDTLLAATVAGMAAGTPGLPTVILTTPGFIS